MSWEEYAQTKSNTLKVYFENGGKFLKHDVKNKRLTMVNSTDEATVFYLNEQCSVACMRLSYRLVTDESGESEYKFTGNITKGEQVIIDKCNEDDYESSNFIIKYDFDSLNKETNFPTVVSFIASKGGYYGYNDPDSVYAFDNYGDSRVVWWNINNTNNNIEAKQNQKYNIINVE